MVGKLPLSQVIHQCTKAAGSYIFCSKKETALAVISKQTVVLRFAAETPLKKQKETSIC